MCDLKDVMVITFLVITSQFTSFLEKMHVDTVVDVIHLYFSRIVNAILPS